MHAARPSQLEPAAEIARHLHAGAYATLVLSGGYEEAGDAGRFRVQPGDVLIHAAFSAHRDRISAARTLVLDLALPDAALDLILRLARRDAREAARLLSTSLVATHASEADLPDLVAHSLTADPSLPVTHLAAQHSVSRETIWRHFTAAYGTDLAAFRAEARARNAWRRISTTRTPLVAIAAETGFSDQAHMSRAVKALTGATPGHWRRATSVQDRARPAA